MTARDPHTDPRVGDLLRHRLGTDLRVADRLVRAVSGAAVSYQTSRLNTCSLDAWRRWCRYVNAQVVEQGDAT